MAATAAASRAFRGALPGHSSAILLSPRVFAPLAATGGLCRSAADSPRMYSSASVSRAATGVALLSARGAERESVDGGTVTRGPKGPRWTQQMVLARGGGLRGSISSTSPLFTSSRRFLHLSSPARQANAPAGAAAPSTPSPSTSSTSTSSTTSPASGGPTAGLAHGASLGLEDIVITPKAARRLAAIKAKALSESRPGAPLLHLRVKVEGGGCSGFRYDFVLESTPLGEEDRVFARKDYGLAGEGVGVGVGGAAPPSSATPTPSIPASEAQVVVDAVSLDLLKGSTLDWDDGLMKSAFVISNNPNAEASCGCKSSFSVKS